MTRRAAVACILAACLAAGLLPQRSQAEPLNLATVSCARYENEVLAATLPGPKADPIDTVMWLFGFSVAKSGERNMFGDSLSAFGFALDAECKNSPNATLLDAVTAVKSKRDNPMDLTRLNCATFETRHAALRKSDSQSADTLTMWLYGYAVGLTGTHVLDAASLGKFDAGLGDRCEKHPEDSLYDALNAPNPAVPRPAATKPPRPKPSAPKP